MRKSIALFFPRRKDRTGTNNTIDQIVTTTIVDVDHSSEDLNSSSAAAISTSNNNLIDSSNKNIKSSRTRNSISVLSPSAEQLLHQKESSRRRSLHSGFFQFTTRRRSTLQTNSSSNGISESIPPSKDTTDYKPASLFVDPLNILAMDDDNTNSDDVVVTTTSGTATVNTIEAQMSTIATTSTTQTTTIQQETNTSQHSTSTSVSSPPPVQPIISTDEPDETEDPYLLSSYSKIPVLEQTKLPRGGVSVETSAVGRVQFGLPPETIKDSMKLGLPVPQVYIVPVERFCREIGPALGVNLAEFEFPAYFNFFVYKKRCTLVVDSADAEENIRRVFSETLLGPEQFRREHYPITYEPEDFAPDFPKDAIPDFQKELKHFRIMPDGKELVIETILNFLHFEMRSDGHDNLGIPPPTDNEAMTAIESEAESRQTNLDLSEGDDALCESNDECLPEESVPADEVGVENREIKQPWTYSQARFMGDVSTVWPSSATPEQINTRSVPRVEIFKMPGGTEYIIHDVDENNIIIGKARISGHIKVSESMSVDGFGGHSIVEDLVGVCKGSEEKEEASESESRLTDILTTNALPPTFHAPSFGVTVLGNSHGFDKSGSVSGYVLWINGRGVMIDPPPYSSATLEKEGIRPRTIVGIILTHCHADHDAGAFQKVLTGSPVVVITTPTIYKSFIRKYAALSALSPALLRHSHRFKPAIIGEPLRFQGATFQFTYTLHTIPCVGFRVEWRGRSMVFTGDHFNSPPDMERLEQSGVLSKARHDDLRNLPLQDCDLLLHEAGAPPIHTPLDVLLKLPEKVKKRLFVVHTSALPPNCELKVAPTGTKGTIRLDTFMRGLDDSNNSITSIHESVFDNNYSFRNEYDASPRVDTAMVSGRKSSFTLQSSILPTHSQEPYVGGPMKGRTSVFNHRQSNDTPLVALRPASSTDAWFILNLLSAVPFISSLSYTSTMELLETARVNAYRKTEVIVPADRRAKVLCVIWEGTCSEAPIVSNQSRTSLPTVEESTTLNKNTRCAVWHAGDWTGPLSMQPERLLSGDSATSATHDIVAVSSEGVKVITVDFASLHIILKNGSSLYSKYLERENALRSKLESSLKFLSDNQNEETVEELYVHELLNSNSALRKLNAVQKRHLESLAEGPIKFQPGDRLWRAGSPVDRAFIIVSGSASFVPRRRNAGSASVADDDRVFYDFNPGNKMQMDAKRVAKELDTLSVTSPSPEQPPLSSTTIMEPEPPKPPSISLEKIFNKSGLSSEPHNPVEKLRQGLERRANNITNDGTNQSVDLSYGSSLDHDSMDTDNDSNMDYTEDNEGVGISSGGGGGGGNGNGNNGVGYRNSRASVIRRRSSKARKVNKVLGRLYSRRAFTGGLVFSRGHFLGDVSKMVAGLLSSDFDGNELGEEPSTYVHLAGTDDNALAELTIFEEGGEQVSHSSTLTAGNEGCVVLVFQRSSLIPFLDLYPGVLLSLLGTQVVV